MDEIPDPFREGVADFDDPLLNEAVRELAGGVEIANALAGMADAESILRAVLSLNQADTIVALLAFALSHLDPHPDDKESAPATPAPE